MQKGKVEINDRLLVKESKRNRASAFNTQNDSVAPSQGNLLL